MHETLTEIRQEEMDRRRRAARYEELTDGVRTHRAQVAALERRAPPSVDALQQIHALCADVPTDLFTRGGRALALALPAGLEVRSLIMVVAGGALDVAREKAEKHAVALAQLRATLAQFESALQEEFNE